MTQEANRAGAPAVEAPQPAPSVVEAQPYRAQLARDIKEAITDIAGGRKFPELLDAVDELAASPAATTQAAAPTLAELERADAKRARPPSDAEPWVVADDTGLRLTFREESAAWHYRDQYSHRLVKPTVTHEPATQAAAGMQDQGHQPASAGNIGSPDNERIDDLLEDLDTIARDYDHHEFGLPMNRTGDGDSSMHKLRQAVRDFLADASQSGAPVSSETREESPKEDPSAAAPVAGQARMPLTPEEEHGIFADLCINNLHAGWGVAISTAFQQACAKKWGIQLATPSTATKGEQHG